MGFWYCYWFWFWYWWNDSAPIEFPCPPPDSTHPIILYSLLHSLGFGILGFGIGIGIIGIDNGGMTLL